MKISLQLSGTKPAAWPLRWSFHQKSPPHPKASGVFCASERTIDGCSTRYSHHGIYIGYTLHIVTPLRLRRNSCSNCLSYQRFGYSFCWFPFCRLSTHRLWHPRAVNQVAHVPTHPPLHQRTHATGPAWPEQSQVLRSKGDSCGQDVVVVMLMSNDVNVFFRSILLQSNGSFLPAISDASPQVLLWSAMETGAVTSWKPTLRVLRTRTTPR